MAMAYCQGAPGRGVHCPDPQRFAKIGAAMSRPCPAAGLVLLVKCYGPYEPVGGVLSGEGPVVPGPWSPRSWHARTGGVPASCTWGDAPPGHPSPPGSIAPLLPPLPASTSACRLLPRASSASLPLGGELVADAGRQVRPRRPQDLPLADVPLAHPQDVGQGRPFLRLDLEDRGHCRRSAPGASRRSAMGSAPGPAPPSAT